METGSQPVLTVPQPPHSMFKGSDAFREEGVVNEA